MYLVLQLINMKLNNNQLQDLYKLKDKMHITVKWGACSAPPVHLYRSTGALFVP